MHVADILSTRPLHDAELLVECVTVCWKSIRDKRQRPLARDFLTHLQKRSCVVLGARNLLGHPKSGLVVHHGKQPCPPPAGAARGSLVHTFYNSPKPTRNRWAHRQTTCLTTLVPTWKKYSRVRPERRRGAGRRVQRVGLRHVDQAIHRGYRTPRRSRIGRTILVSAHRRGD